VPLDSVERSTNVAPQRQEARRRVGYRAGNVGDRIVAANQRGRWHGDRVPGSPGMRGRRGGGGCTQLRSWTPAQLGPGGHEHRPTLLIRQFQGTSQQAHRFEMGRGAQASLHVADTPRAQSRAVGQGLLTEPRGQPKLAEQAAKWKVSRIARLLFAITSYWPAEVDLLSCHSGARRWSPASPGY
jgi:hypothetical protein